MLERIVIRNFKKLDYRSIFIDPELTILVGDNDSGKSTILQALEMVIGGRIYGRSLDSELSPTWFSARTVVDYCEKVSSGERPTPPSIEIEAYFADSQPLQSLKGQNNSLGKNQPGLRLEIAFDPLFDSEYQSFLDSASSVSSVPIEFYRIHRFDFAGIAVSGAKPLVRCSLIDATTLRLQSGTDYYLRKAVENHLSDDVRARMSLALRSFREQLGQTDAFVEANGELNQSNHALNAKTVGLYPDSSLRNSWESTITPHLDEIPFSQTGKGEQSAFKILLALEKSTEANRDIVLIEEPENHLSFANMNSLIKRIKDRVGNQQLIITTHSSFVLNKLGLDKLRLLGSKTEARHFHQLPSETLDYFYKLSGFDTLRLVLASRVILVEGPSDELIVLTAFKQLHSCSPLEKGVDVVDVQSLAFRRFLELGKPLGTRIAIITDLDDENSDEKARRRFKDYENERIKGFVGKPENGRTLEPQLVAAIGLQQINEILGTEYGSSADAASYMKEKKTEAALAIFNHDQTVGIPDYIKEAIDFVLE